MNSAVYPGPEFAAALEGAEVVSCRDFCRAAADLYPEGGIRAIDVGGGVANFYGPSDPLNSVKGVGLNGPVDRGEWEMVEQHYFATRSPVVIDLCPLADEGFVAMLGERGYRIGSFETVTVRPVAVDLGAVPALQSDVRFTIIDPADTTSVESWTRVVNIGFADGGEPMKFAIDFGRVRASVASREQQPRTYMVLATVSGEPAGGAAMSIARAEGGPGEAERPLIALMAGAAVLPAFRRRGIQNALTAHRLLLAARAGCRYASLCVRAGSASHRNACRAGFEVAYTRPQMVFAPPK